MAKSYCEMSVSELQSESEIWWAIVSFPKGPSGPSNAMRAQAEKFMNECDVWAFRKKQLGNPLDGTDG